MKAMKGQIKCHLSVADKFDKTIINSLQQGEALKQSIWRKAFVEELVILSKFYKL
jgi:hypothetical protein